MKPARILTAAVLCFGAAHRSDAQSQTGTPPVGSAAIENQTFDAHRHDPIEVLRQLYEEKQILVLGFSHHRSETYFRVLHALLDKVGHDPRLKYVVLERWPGEAVVLEELSVNRFTESDLMKRFPDLPTPSIGAKYPTARYRLCIAGELAYPWAKLLPHVQALNARRPSSRKLLVTEIEGMPLGIQPESFEREFRTANNFWEGIGKRLTPSEKVIVVYNAGHVTKRVSRRIWFRKNKYYEPSEPLAGNWLSMLLRQHPEAEAQLAVALLDYEGDNNPHGMLRFSQRQVARYPGQAWGVRLAPFRGGAAERGREIFDPKADRTLVPDTMATLPDVYDAVVWQPNAQQELFKTGVDYLPTACRDIRLPSVLP
jgi:hypothetical protein